jgi:hypothetical protein
MREVRDKFLRHSRIGFSPFDRLFDGYNGFSPELCRLMAVSPALRERIEKHFVRPLTLVLGLIHDYTLGGAHAEELGLRFEAGLADSPKLTRMSLDEARKAVAVLDAMKRGAPLPDPVLNEISRLLSERAMASPPVRWALIDTVAIYAQAVLWRLQGVNRSSIGRLLADSFDQWAIRMPVTQARQDLGSYETRQELAFLKQCLRRTPQARRQFGKRLRAGFPEHDRLEDLLGEAADFPQRRPS